MIIPIFKKINLIMIMPFTIEIPLVKEINSYKKIIKVILNNILLMYFKI